jgi:hypothetical protein
MTAPVEHVPADQTGWVRLGTISTRAGTLAIVDAEQANELGADWDNRVKASWNTTDRQEQEELVITNRQWQQITAGGESALYFSVEQFGHPVEGRFGDVYGTGHMSLIEIRVRLWTCACVCHEEQDIDEADACDGTCCHDDSQ